MTVRCISGSVLWNGQVSKSMTADPAAINLEIAFEKAIRDAIIDVLQRHGGKLPEKKVCKILGITPSDIPLGNDAWWERVWNNAEHPRWAHWNEYYLEVSEEDDNN